MRRAAYPRMALEMILIKVGQIRPVLPIEQLIEKLDLLRREIHEVGISGSDSQAEPDERWLAPIIKNR